ncbi:MAG: ShlB/FhaC/HecB family hemolysin secretion/activation protein [Cyanobacteria bacterium P01_F01_bin.86]
MNAATARAFTHSEPSEEKALDDASISPHPISLKLEISQISIPNDPLPLPPDQPAPLPEVPPSIEPLPNPEELLRPTPDFSPSDNSQPSADDIEERVIVKQFVVIGSTIFTNAEFEEALSSFQNRPLTFSELLDARDTITDLYINQGYVTSGAFIPAEQIVEDGIVIIQVLEGELSDIKIEGNQRLKSAYIRSRVNLASGPPLNIQELLEALQVLQLNPIIESIAAELVATPNPGESTLIVRLQEAQTFSLNVQLNNYESPLLSTFQQRVEASEENLTGRGDNLTLSYQHAGSSNVFEAEYNLPVSPRNTSLDLRYAYTDSEITQTELSLIAPQSETHTWEVGLSHPVLETPEDKITLGLHLEQRISQSFIEPFGVSRTPFGFPGSGSTDEGFTRATILQFSQEWQHRTPNQLIFLDSRFRLGTNWLGATGSSDTDEPDIEFFAWQGQALWLQRLNPDWLLVTRAAGQVADRPLIASELFGLGGANNVRGYRKDQILSDSGFLISLEVQTPILRWPEQDTVISLAPFIDYGVAWNRDDQSLSEESLVAIGTGLIFQISENFTARLDYALPLIDVSGNGNTWQESGFLFLIDATLF